MTPMPWYRMIPIRLIISTHSMCLWQYYSVDVSLPFSIRPSVTSLCTYIQTFAGYRDNIALYLYTHWHDDVIKYNHFPRYWPFVRGIHRSPVNSPHKGQWRGALIFSFICAWINHLSKQSWGWWFEPRPLWRHSNVYYLHHDPTSVIDIMKLESSLLNWSGPFCYVTHLSRKTWIKSHWKVA